MAVSNPFKRHIAAMMKYSTGKIVVHRDGDQVYICDGASLLRVPVFYYDNMIRPLGVMFEPLQPGEQLSRTSSAVLATREPNPGHAFRDTLSRTEATAAAKISGFTLAVPSEKRNYRLVVVDGKPLFYNDAYITALLDYCGTLGASADRFPALKWEEEDGPACLLLPINTRGNASCAAALDELRELLKV